MSTPTITKLAGSIQGQLQIYFAGTQNKKQLLPVSYEGPEQKAREVMKPEAFAYIVGGAGAETTLKTTLVLLAH